MCWGCTATHMTVILFSWGEKMFSADTCFNLITTTDSQVSALPWIYTWWILSGQTPDWFFCSPNWAGTPWYAGKFHNQTIRPCAHLGPAEIHRPQARFGLRSEWTVTCSFYHHILILISEFQRRAKVSSRRRVRLQPHVATSGTANYFEEWSCSLGRAGGGWNQKHSIIEQLEKALCIQPLLISYDYKDANNMSKSLIKLKKKCFM